MGNFLWGNGVSKENLETKHIVIIGGGYGGMELAAELQNLGIPFTLIDPKEFFHHNVGALRATVCQEWMKQTVINFKETFGDKFIQAKVSNVDFETKKVFLEDSDKVIGYTDVVFAVGSDGPFPGRPNSKTIETVTEEYLILGQEIEKANNIVIVGGGATGVEMAGEIGDKYKLKKIVLIHSHEELVCDGMGPKFQTNIKFGLENMNVELFLGDKVENMTDLDFSVYKKQTIKTSKGHKIECDLILKCTGLGPNTSMTKTVFDESKFDENNRLKVNEYLQIEGLSNVYGIGDCINTQETKMAAHATTHAHLVASNFIRELNGQTLLPYKQKFEGILVTVGAYSGAGKINGWNLPSMMVSFVKGRSLFTSKYWSIMGQSQPN